jgi:uncharacterized protein (TIRG00374 family)
VSPSGRRWALTVARLVLTAGALFVVARMIRVDDSLVLLEPEKPPVEAADATIESRTPAAVVLRWKDGHTSTHEARAVQTRPGLKTLLSRIDRGLFFAMVAALLVPISFLAARWWALLAGHGFPVPFGRVFFMTYAGFFFNRFLPGAVGGDLTKALLAVSGEERKAAVVGTVILDRLIGLAVMIVLGAISITPVVRRFHDPRLAIVVYGLLGGMVLAYLVYFNPVLRTLVGSRLPFQKVRQELDGVFRSMKEKKRLVAWSALLSLCAQSSGILVIFGLAQAIGAVGVGLWAFFVFEPVIFIVTAIPLSLGGWGVQELVYERLFGGFGGMDPNQAVALSILYTVSTILVTIPGGVLFALGAARRRPVPSGLPDRGV